MQLSESIRLGAKLCDKAEGALFKEGASCALGAAYESTFHNRPYGDVDPDHDDYFDIVDKQDAKVMQGLCSKYPLLKRTINSELWPKELIDRAKSCAYTNYTKQLSTLIIELNDEFHWDRVKISEWVATIEKEYKPKRKVLKNERKRALAS